MAINYENINKGGISLAANFELLSEKPLDSRSVVPVFKGLQDLITSNAAYEGMLVYDEETKKTYQASSCEEYVLNGKTYSIIFIEFIPESEGMQTNDNYGNTFGVKEETLVGDVLLVPNEAVSLASNSEGNNTIAGVKAFQITEWENLKKIELDDFVHPKIENSNVLGIYTLDSVEGITPINLEEYFIEGVEEIHPRDKFSIKYSYNYDFYSEVVAVGPDNDPNNLLQYINQYIEGGLLQNQIVAFGEPKERDDGYTFGEYGYPKLWFPGNPTIGTTPWGTGQHSEGDTTKAVGTQSHAEGYGTIAAGRYSHAEGKQTIAGYAAHSEGRYTQALGQEAHAEGYNSKALGTRAHAEGTGTKAIGGYSHAQGMNTVAEGQASFAGGYGTRAVGAFSTALGSGTIATRVRSTAVGSYNEERDDAYFIVGKGTGNANRSNAFVVLEDGSAEVTTVGNNPESVVTRSVFDPTALKASVAEATSRANIIYTDADESAALPLVEKFDSIYSGVLNVTPSTDATLYKYGLNLIKIDPVVDKIIPNTTIKYSANENGITFKADSAPASNTKIPLSSYKIPYLPKGTYTLFTNSNSRSPHVILSVSSAENAQIMNRYLSSNASPVITLTEDVTNVYFTLRVLAKLTSFDEITLAPILTPIETTTPFFVPFEEPVTISTMADAETLVPMHNSNGIFLFSDNENVSISYKRQLSVKDYVEEQFEQTWIFNCGTSTSVLD